MRPSQYNLIENHGERTLVMNAKTGASFRWINNMQKVCAAWYREPNGSQMNCAKRCFKEECC